MFRRQAVGIDLGVTFVRVFVKGRGIVLREPSVVALSRETNEVVAAGHDVARLEAADVVSVRPMHDGMVADDGLTETLLKTLMNRAGLGSGRLSQPDIVICTPPLMAEVEKNALLNAMREEAREVVLVETPLAAALGAGLDVSGAGRMVVDVGGGATCVALIGRGTVVAAESLRVAGNEFDEAIVRMMRQKGVLIGDRTAEEVKLELGTALAHPKAESVTVRGRDIKTGATRTASVSASEVAEALQGPLLTLAAGVRRVFERASSDLAAHVVGSGVVLTGGGSRLRHLDSFLQQQIGVPFGLADQPADCTVLGLGRVLDSPNLRTMDAGERSPS